MSSVGYGEWWLFPILPKAAMLSIARTDVSRGGVLGQTITTDTRTGNLLVALLAVLSTIGKRLSMHKSSYADKVQVRLICGILSRS